ncbi:MAG: Gfo/Idh/MocA family oxidoreductase [Phycisphaerales bacterium]
MAEKKILNVAVIGLRHLHPRAYMPLFEDCKFTKVVCAFEEKTEVLESFCKDFNVKGYTELNQMLAKETIDIAAIFLPHCDCANAAIKCAQKGIHLMVEKPIAESSASVKKVIAAAKKYNVKLTTCYCWRYHPVIVAMKKIMNEGVLGEIVSVEARLAAGRVDRYIAGNSEWMLQKKKSGGGPLYNLGVHWIDLLHYLLGDDIDQVCAINTKTSDAYDIEDNSIAMLKFKRGTTGVLSTSYIVPACFPCGRDLYIGIKGTKGVLSYCPKYEGEGGSGSTAQTDILEVYSDSEKQAGSSVRKLSFQLDKVQGYSGYMGKAYLGGFVDAIFKNKQPFITGNEAVSVLNVVEAIYKSDEQIKWVKVRK